MRHLEMLTCHIIILLLVWRCDMVMAGNTGPNIEELDQVAMASIVRIENATRNHSTLERPFDNVEITTIRYENSNGFVPITQDAQTTVEEVQTNFAENYTVDGNFTSEEHLSLFIKNPDYSKDEKSLENDPFYSTEARIFLSLTQPMMNRRSSDFQESSDDFELLRINNDTPTVANYENFYNSLSGTNTNQRNRGKEGDELVNTQTEFYQDRRNLAREKNYSDNRSRSKKIENYLLNYGENVAAQTPRNVVTGSQFFSYSQIHEDQNKNRYKEPSSSVRNSFPNVDNFDYNSEKKVLVPQNSRDVPQQNYNQHDGANYPYNIKNSQKVEPLTDVNHHLQPRPKPKSSRNVHRSRFNVKHNSSPKIKSFSNVQTSFETISPRTQTYNSNTRSEEPPTYFEHEALFNRDETNNKYDKIEEAKELSDENYEYIEMTEKPRRFRKQRKRINGLDDSKRLPKEHRDFDDSIDNDETPKPRNRLRPKIRNHKTRVNAWPEHESSIHEDEADGDGGFETVVESTVNTETRKQKFHKQNQNQNHNHNNNENSKDNSWANVSPNVEISHSSGIEIDQLGKPKLVVPIKVNIVPLSNFDHATALGNSQGFDLSNAVLQNFVTATPIAFSNGSPITSILNTPQSIFDQNVAKTLHNLQNQNLKVQTPVPEVIVGQNTFQNPIQTILIPQQNYQNQQKFGQNIRNTFMQNNQNSYGQNAVANPNLQQTNFNMPQQNLSPLSLQGNLPIQNHLFNTNQNPVQNFANPNLNQIQNIQNNPSFNNPHPTPQTFESFPQNIGQASSNYNVHVNPFSLQGQNLPPAQSLYSPPNNLGYSTTPSTNYQQNGNLETTDNYSKKNTGLGTNGQYVASASLTVGEQMQNQINAQNNMRQPTHENFNPAFRNDNLSPKPKGFIPSPEAAASFGNFQHQNGPGTQIINRDHPNEHISQASSAIAQTYKDQNQQILKVANDIFESTLKQLKQLQRSQASKSNRLNENSNFQNLGKKNVEIMNPGLLRPSLIDQTFNPTENSNNFGGIGLTTAFPIFATTGFDTFRTPALSTVGPLSIHGYVDSLTELGAKENDLKTSPTTISKPNPPDQRLEPVLFNPINFVPNVDTLKAQKALNNKYNVHEPLLQGLNLVPIIPGGNFYKNSYFTHDDTMSKPKLSSDLQKYAEEMFKESLKTIYNTHKWNNDHKAQGSEISSVTTSPKVKEGQNNNFKFSLPDIKPSKQILEAHFSETGSKDENSQISGMSSKPGDESKKPSSQNSDFSDNVKPISVEPVRFYYKPNIHVNRPTIADTSHPDFKFSPDFGTMDYIHDFLTPPKPNAYISQSPFNEPIPKRRPGHKRPNFESGNGPKFHNRPENGPPRPSQGVVETASSNIAHQSFPFDTPRYEFLQGKAPFDQESQDFESVDYPNSHSGMRGQNYHPRYPSLTTSSPILDDYHKPNSHNYDYNHPRMHNLMGLLRKNKRLPPGNSQSLFSKKEGTEEQLENDKRPDRTQFPKENSKSIIEKKSDVKSFETNMNSTVTEKSHA